MNDRQGKNQINEQAWISPFSRQHKPGLPALSAGTTQFSPGP
jgi:hypothetical protein